MQDLALQAADCIKQAIIIPAARGPAPVGRKCTISIDKCGVLMGGELGLAQHCASNLHLEQAQKAQAWGKQLNTLKNNIELEHVVWVGGRVGRFQLRLHLTFDPRH